MAALISDSLSISRCCKTMNKGPVCCMVCLFTSQLMLVPNYNAGWQRQMCLNYSPKVALDSAEAGYEPETTISSWKSNTLTVMSHPAQRNCTYTLTQTNDTHTSAINTDQARAVLEVRLAIDRHRPLLGAKAALVVSIILQFLSHLLLKFNSPHYHSPDIKKSRLFQTKLQAICNKCTFINPNSPWTSLMKNELQY